MAPPCVPKIGMLRNMARPRPTGTTTSVPNRYEMKYLIPDGLTGPIREAIEPFCALDAHGAKSPGGQYVITSLYLDSPRRAFHRAKMARQRKRLKLRIRTYGAQSEGPVFLEVKRRIGDIVAKGRVRLPRAAWASQLQMPVADDATSAERDFRAVMTLNGANPMLLARYAREAYVSEVDDYARVTFDRRLVYQRCHAWDLSGEPTGWLPQDDRLSVGGVGAGVILELKSTVDVPRWMAGLIRRFGLVRAGYSKYCTGVERVWGAENLLGFTDRVARWW